MCTILTVGSASLDGIPDGSAVTWFIWIVEGETFLVTYDCDYY